MAAQRQSPSAEVSKDRRQVLGWSILALGRAQRGGFWQPIIRITLLVVVGLSLSTPSAIAAAEGPTIRVNGSPGNISEEGVTQTCAGPFSVTIEPNGFETSWQFDYEESEQMVIEGHGKPLPGGSGTIPGEDALDRVATGQVCGLVPETIYYVGLIATNAIGEAKTLRSFETVPLRPRVGGISVSSVTTESANVVGAVIPDEYETEWRFEYATDQKSLEEGHGEKGPEGVIPQAEADEEFHHPAGELTNLKEGTTYYVRLLAENTHGKATPSSILEFQTDGPPSVATAAIHAIHGENMRAVGEVRSDGLDTHYHTEYVSQEQFARNGFAEAISTPEFDAGIGSSHPEVVRGHEVVVFDSIIVGDDLPGLQAGTVYHYRIVATNAAASKPLYGNEQVIRVPVPGPAEEPSCSNKELRVGASAPLPDCRAYEQVTPTDKEGAQDIFNYSPQGDDPTVVGEDGDHFMLHAAGVQWGSDIDAAVSDYFFAHTPKAWQMTSTTPQPQAGVNSYRPTIFTPDLTSVGLEVEWETVAHHTESEEIEFKIGSPGGPYTAVVSVPRADRETANGEGWVAASLDGSKFVLQVKDHALAGATGTISGSDLYEFSEGQLRQVNVGIGACGAQAAVGGENTISADGSRVLFEAVPGSECAKPEHVYMRVDGGSALAKTVDVGEYHLLTTNRDSSRLLLERRSGGMYEFFLYTSESGSTKLLFATDESVHLEVSAGFTAVYFVTNERLTEDTPASFSVRGGPGSGYLYRYDLSTGGLSFLVETAGNTSAGSPAITPDGQDYYWSSTEVGGVPGGGDLPGGILPTSKTYVSDGGPTLQRYRYDSVENAVECVSCASQFNPEPHESTDGAFGQSSISENGEYAIFATAAELVSQDVDGEHPLSLEAGGLGIEDSEADFEYSVSSDVYEWRKNGVGGCSHVQGCIALISSGAGGLRNAPVGINPSGRDIFFTTHSQLVPQDTDLAGDVYDARIGGGYPPPIPPPTECDGDACQNPVTAPIDTTPASLSFSGPGNTTGPVVALAAKTKPRVIGCRKGFVRKRNKCVKRQMKVKRGQRPAARRSTQRQRGGHR